MDNALELYCHGVEPIEKLGPMRRLIFTTPDTKYPGHRNVVVKLIVTAELLAMFSCLAANDPRGVSPELLALETNIAN